MRFKTVSSILFSIYCILQINFTVGTGLVSANPNPVVVVNFDPKFENVIESAPVGIKTKNRTDSSDKYFCSNKATTVPPSSRIGFGYNDWDFSDGWFKHFKNGTDIPTGIDYTNDTKYEVGFPVGFQPEKFLNQSNGIWMTVHDILPHDIDQPIPYIYFNGTGSQIKEFGSVEVKCYLHENSSLELRFDNPDNGQFIFDNTNNSSKTDWDVFNATTDYPFRQMYIRVTTESNSSFVIIASLTLTDWVPPIPTTTSTTEATGDETSTVDELQITTITPQLKPTTEDIETNNGTNILNNYFQCTFPFIIVMISLKNLV